MEATRVTVDELKERINRGEEFAFVDTRNPKAWGEAETKLPGAIRVPADEVEQHLAQMPLLELHDQSGRGMKLDGMSGLVSITQELFGTNGIV